MKSEIAVTTDGKKNSIINGATDWVYEEEFSMDVAYARSPDGKKIAYYKFDESNVKEFNLTCYSETANVYTINTIETYYSLGTIKDITKHIKSDSINLNRSKTYKKINFRFET